MRVQYVVLTLLLSVGPFLMTGASMAQAADVTPLMSKDLTESPGREVLMITVEKAPGGSDPIHRHNAHGFIYVLEGSMGGHVVGRNASSTQPVTFLVFLLKDKGAPILVPGK